MSPGAAEEMGKVATGFIDTMKTQPLALALVLMNAGLMVLFWFILDRFDKQNTHREELVRQEQKEIRDMLSKCKV
jgi:hypothetical protein